MGVDGYSSGSFFAGDKLVVTVHSLVNPGVGDSYSVTNTTTGSQVISQRSSSANYTIPSNTNDTFNIHINVFEQTGNYVSWSCTPTSNPPAAQSQSITFTSTPSSPNVGATYNPQANGGGSGNGISFSIDGSTTNNACSISGSTVSFNNVGTCVIDANQAGGISNGVYYSAAPQAQQSVSVAVAKQNQTITFNSGPPRTSISSPPYDVDVSASSGLPVDITIDSSSASICTANQGRVTFQAVGTCVINANQAGSSTYNAAPQVQQRVTVSKDPQFITYSTRPPSPAIPGGTYAPSASSTSGLTVSFTIDPTSATVCSISNNVVSFLTPGSCVLNADQAGNAQYAAASQAQQTFTIAKLNQTISFTSTAPAATPGGATYMPSANASPSGLPVTFTIDAASTSVCSIAGGTVSFQAPGSCIIDANQSGNSTYSAAPQVQQTVTVGKATQTISFTTNAPAAVVNGPTYTPSANASPSGLTVAFTIDATSSSVCSISAGTVSFQAAGSCIIDANQNGNATYNAAAQVQQVVTVGKGTQTISFTTNAPAAVVNGPTYTPSANASPSGLTVAFTIDPTSASICSISGGVVSFQAAGSCVIDANQTGSANYNSAQQVQQTVTVGKGTQTISFTSTAPAAIVNGPTYTPSANASPSGLTVAFTIDAVSASVCSISGGVVSFQASGSCVIDANQTGSANYNSAQQVQQTVTVGKGIQTISFTTNAPAAAVSGPTYTPSANASPSGLAVAFTIDAASASICSISGGTVSFQASGSCVIDANQTGSPNYNPAQQVQQTVTVGMGSQSIAFSSTAPTTAVVNGPTYTPSATALSSGLTVAFTIDATSASVCSISGGVVSFQASGSCVIDANQTGSANYRAAAQVQQTVTVGKGTQSISFTSTAPTTAVVSGPTYTPSATASPSGLTVAFTIDAASASICSISGGTVSFQASGSCVINANQAGSANYNPAPQAQQTVTVGKGTQTITFTSTAPSASVNGPTYTPTATASPSGLTVAFTIDAASASVCSISGGAVSFQASGSCVINANQSGSANYNPAPQVQQTVTVGKGTQTIAFSSAAPAAAASGPTYTPTATASPSGLTVAFTIDAGSTSVCSISGGAVSFQASGSCVINANQSGSANYNPAPQVQQTVTVGKGAQVIGFTSSAPNAAVSGPTYTPTATASPSGLTVAFTIDAGSASVCSISGGVVSFQGPGTCVISANQSGNTNYLPAPPKQQSFNVGKASPAILVQASSVSILFGVPNTFTATLSGAVTPAGTVTFKDGNATLGTVGLSGSRATFAATGFTVGSHSITAVYNGDANNNAATSPPVTVNVGARPDPSQNAAVQAQVAAEVSSATRFAQTQIDNVFRRFEQIHDEDDNFDGAQGAMQPQTRSRSRNVATAGSPAGTGTATDNRSSGSSWGSAVSTQVAAGDSVTSSGGSRSFANSFGAVGLPGSGFSGNGLMATNNFAGRGDLTGNDVAAGGFGRAAYGTSGALAYSNDPIGQRHASQLDASRALSQMASVLPAGFGELNKRLDLPYHLWASGSMDFGRIGNAGAFDTRFNTSGLTLGADARIADGLKAGIAVGFGMDHSPIGTDGTKSDATTYNVTGYASWRFLPHSYLDASIGYGALRYALARWSADGGVMLKGNRGGNDIYGSVSLTRDFKWNGWKLLPYGRLDVVKVTLDSYAEIGSPAWVLAYNQLTVTSVSGLLGLRVAYPVKTSWGTLTPMARLEYRHAFDGGFTQGLNYVDLAGLGVAGYSFSGITTVRDTVTGGLMLRLQANRQLAFDLEYLLSAGNQYMSQGVRGAVRYGF